MILPGNERQNARYRELRKLQYPGKWSAQNSTVERFCAAVMAKGHDPSEYGELSLGRRGGRRVIGPTPSMLRAHVLRELGADEEEARAGSRSRATFNVMSRRLLVRKAKP